MKHEVRAAGTVTGKTGRGTRAPHVPRLEVRKVVQRHGFAGLHPHGVDSLELLDIVSFLLRWMKDGRDRPCEVEKIPQVALVVQGRSPGVVASSGGLVDHDGRTRHGARLVVVK